MGAVKEIKLKSGKKVTVDVSTLTVREWRNLWDMKVPDEESDAVLARLCGLDPESVPDMLRDDLRLIVKTVVDLANSPLDPPNSQSESITE